MKQRNDWKAIGGFLMFMLVMTAVCQVVSWQKKPLAVIEEQTLPGVILDSCLYDLQESEGRAGIYIAEEIPSDPGLMRARKASVLLEEKTADGYMVSAAGERGNLKLISWASGELAEGSLVRARSREMLSCSGTWHFVNRTDGSKQEAAFFGIPQEEEAKLRRQLGLDDSWIGYLQTEETGAYTAQRSLIMLLWLCVAAIVTSSMLICSLRRFYSHQKQKLQQLYWQEILRNDLTGVLLHGIWWLCLVFILLALLISFRTLDFDFLAEWLPRERTLDLQHYLQYHRSWKARTMFYLDNYDDSYAKLLRGQLQAWRQLGYHGAAALGLLGLWSVCRRFWGRGRR